MHSLGQFFYFIFQSSSQVRQVPLLPPQQEFSLMHPSPAVLPGEHSSGGERSVSSDGAALGGGI